jgi:hypothetical protein
MSKENSEKNEVQVTAPYPLPQLAVWCEVYVFACSWCSILAKVPIRVDTKLSGRHFISEIFKILYLLL